MWRCFSHFHKLLNDVMLFDRNIKSISLSSSVCFTFTVSSQCQPTTENKILYKTTVKNFLEFIILKPGAWIHYWVRYSQNMPYFCGNQVYIITEGSKGRQCSLSLFSFTFLARSQAEHQQRRKLLSSATSQILT